MYLAKVVEIAQNTALLTRPQHRYTEALLSAGTGPPTRRQHASAHLEGRRPEPDQPAPGCRFHTCCRYAFERCPEDEAEMREVPPGHHVACNPREVQTAAFSEAVAVPA